jgi:hypothetical protein
MAAAKQKADTASATLDRIHALLAEIKQALPDLEKRISELEVERGCVPRTTV